VVEFQSLKQVQVAAAFGVHRLTVAKWTKEGCPRNEDGSYSLPDVIQWSIDRAKGKIPDGAAAANSLDAEKWLTEYRKERALKAKAEREHVEGKLIEKHWVDQILVDFTTYVKRHVFLLAKRLPGRLVGKTEPVIAQVIEEELHEIFDTAAKQLRKHAKQAHA